MSSVPLHPTPRKRLPSHVPAGATAGEKPRRRIVNRPEQGLQKACVEVLVKFVPPPPEGPFWSAVNPVPAKSKAVAGLSKAMGMKAGVPDLLMVWKGRVITVEFKAEKGGRVSEAQKERRDEIILAGGLWLEVRSVDQFIETLHMIGIPCRARVIAKRS